MSIGLRLLLCVLLCASGQRLRAASAAENRAFENAHNEFEDGFWERAEGKFGAFVKDYPKSFHVPEAVLLQAQAQMQQGKVARAIALLEAGQPEAGTNLDRYLFWQGKAYFQNTNYLAAAEAYGRLAREFPASRRRLEASLNEASARAKLEEWKQVAELLRDEKGSFQQSSVTNADSELVVLGRLLLAEAELVLRNNSGAESALSPLAGRNLRPELDWRRQHLLCRARLESGRPEEAWACSIQLLALAEITTRRDLLAESVAFQAGVCERLRKIDEAIAAYRRNLGTNAPVARQRQALLKIVELTLAQNSLAEAGQTLEQLVGQFLDSPAGDVALLTLGELRLKQFVLLHESSRTNKTVTDALTITNPWPQALQNFDRLINVFSNSDLVGRAELNRGWCFWLSNQIAENSEMIIRSADAFQRAAARLPPSEDLAVARFKLADALFLQTNYAGAQAGYRAALEIITNQPIAAALAPRAYFQLLRASIALNDFTTATNVMALILASPQPDADMGSSLILLGQGFSDRGAAEVALQVYTRFLEKFPQSDLRPQVELLAARSAEQIGDWRAAISLYDAWLARFPTNALRPRAEFNRAWAYARAGDETNALILFTNLVANVPANGTNELAPLAQWWVADHFFTRGDFAEAEKNYKLLYLKWPNSSLANEACMMAGRAAIGRPDYEAAIGYFTNLTSNPKCPAPLKAQALFAYGDALKHWSPAETNKLANVEEARKVFSAIQQLYPETEHAATAWGEIGNCCLQLATQDPLYYEAASNAYQQVIVAPRAGVIARSEAEVGLGKVLELLAGRTVGDEQRQWLTNALHHYLNVFREENLRDGEAPDLFWVKKAGLEAAHLCESDALLSPEQAIRLYRRLQTKIPALSASLEKKIERARERKPGELR